MSEEFTQFYTDHHHIYLITPFINFTYSIHKNTTQVNKYIDILPINKNTTQVDKYIDINV